MIQLQRVWSLIYYDTNMQLRERGNQRLLALIVVIAWFGLYLGAKFQQQVSEATQNAVAQEATARATAAAYAKQFFDNPNSPENQAQFSFKNPADMRGYAFREHLGFAVKPSATGAALAIAQADILPSYVRVKAESMDSARNSNELEHPWRLAVGRFDLMFVVLFLWPLVLLAFASSVLTHDRELGRVNALRLQGVALWQMVLVQIMARLGLASAIFILVVGGAAFIFGVLPVTLAGGFSFLQWALLVVLYSGFWASLAAVICAFAQNRSTAAFAAFGGWVVFVVLMPALLTAGIGAVSPIPAREAYLVEVRNATDRIGADRLKRTARFYDQHPQWRPPNTPVAKVSGAVMRLARASEMEKELDAVEAKFDQARQNQARWFANWMVLSPVSLAHYGLSQVSGNDSARHDLFMRDVREHQLQMHSFFQSRIQQAALVQDAAPCQHPSTTCLPGFGFVEHEKVLTFSAAPALLVAPTIPTQAWWLLLWIAGAAALMVFLLKRRTNL